MREITARANTTDMALFHASNMGFGLDCIASADKVDDVVQVLKDNGERRARTGYVKASSGEVYLPDGSQV